MSLKIQRVGIDLDNTVADFLTTAIPLLKEHYGLEPDFNKVVYKIEEVFGLTQETRLSDIQETLYEGLHLFRDLPKLEKNIEQLTHKLISREINTKIYIITSRTPSKIIVDDTLHWLHSNNFKFTDIFFTDNKTNLCKIIGIDVMIEDEVGQTLSLAKENINVVIRDHPWNRHNILIPFEKQRIIKRQDNWQNMLYETEEFLK